MLIRCVEERDVKGWRSLAGEVAELFDSPNMPNEKSFLNYIDGKIKKQEAIVAVDQETHCLIGVIGFSKKNNSISWFAVKREYRRQGVGVELLQQAIKQLDYNRDMSVITFDKGSIGGGPARNLYEKLGFVECESNLIDENGNLRCKMLRKAGSMDK